MIENHIDKRQGKLVSKNKRFADLAALGETVFHAGDLVNIWGIKEKSTLYQTLSRYTALGLIIRIHKGFYSLKNPNALNPSYLGVKSLHTYGYVSCQSILAKHGVINQSPREIILVSNVSKRFQIAGKQFRSRKIADRFLHNNAGIETIDSTPTASLPRALADMLYLNPETYFDAHQSNLIDWQKVKEVAEKVGYNVRLPLL